jgi:hypothetical protein
MIAMSAPEPDGNADAASEARPPKRAAGPLDVVKTVLSGFFGVGRRARHESVRLTPVQIIVTGLVAAALFVGSLLLLVSFILSRVGAGG